MTKKTEWIDYFSNGQAVREVFGERIPELRELELMGLALHFTSSLTFALDLDDFPDPAPRRWKDKRFNKLRLVMSFGIGSFAMSQRDDYPAMWQGSHVSVTLSDSKDTALLGPRGGVLAPDESPKEIPLSRLRVISKDGGFELTASVFPGTIKFEPYYNDPREPPSLWPGLSW